MTGRVAADRFGDDSKGVGERLRIVRQFPGRTIKGKPNSDQAAHDDNGKLTPTFGTFPTEREADEAPAREWTG